MVNGEERYRPKTGKGSSKRQVGMEKHSCAQSGQENALWKAASEPRADGGKGGRPADGGQGLSRGGSARGSTLTETAHPGQAPQ